MNLSQDEPVTTTDIVLDLYLCLGVYETFTAAAIAAECRGAGIPADHAAIRSALDRRVGTGELRRFGGREGEPVYMMSGSYWRVDTPAAC